MKIKITSLNYADSNYDFIVKSAFNIPTVLQGLYQMLIELGHDVDYGCDNQILDYDIIFVGCCFLSQSLAMTPAHVSYVSQLINRASKLICVYNSWQVSQSYDDFCKLGDVEKNKLSRLFNADTPALVPAWNSCDLSLMRKNFPHNRIYSYNPCQHIPSRDYGVGVKSEKSRVPVYSDMSMMTKLDLEMHDIDVEVVNFSTRRTLMHERELVEQVYSRSWFILMPSHLETQGMGFWRSRVQHAVNVGSVLVADRFESSCLGDVFCHDIKDLLDMDEHELEVIVDEQKHALESELNSSALANFEYVLRQL